MSKDAVLMLMVIIPSAFAFIAGYFLGNIYGGVDKEMKEEYERKKKWGELFKKP